MDVIIVDDEPAARRTVRECCERESDLRIVSCIPAVAQLGKKLAEHMPPASGLSVSYFTNSGSEANEIAILSAREFTGNPTSSACATAITAVHRPPWH